MTWDEENRLSGINDNGRIYQFTYDAAGERVIKSSGDSQNVAINGETAATIVHTDDYTGYISPYFVISKGKFTKHYFEGAGRIVSKLGNGTFAQPLGITAGGVNYGKLTAEQQKALDTYVKSLGVPSGPPTQQGIYATPEFTGDAYPSSVITPVEENQEPPEGWPRNPIFNTPGDVPGPPVQFGPPVEPTTVKPGEGFTGIGLPENDIFYFHPDHLGSTSYITTKNGSISQHVEYIAFGEVLFEEHSSSFSSPYLFNGKELDRETNLSYYGARYLDMKTSLWLNVDPLTAMMPNYGAYVYTFNNPVRFTDPTGMIAEPPTGVDAEDGAIHTDSSGSWKYDKASTTWKGQDGSKDIGNTIELDNVNIKGYKNNYVSSGEYGPSYGREKDLQYSLMLVGAIAAPIVAVEGGIAAGGAYLWSEGVAAFSAITTETALTGMGINTLSQYIANGGNVGDINMLEVGSSAIPGLGPVVFGETFSYSFNNVLDGKFVQAPDFSSSKGWKTWGVQVGGGIISNRFGNATDNYLLNEGVGGKIIGGYFTGLIETGSNAAPGLIK